MKTVLCIGVIACTVLSAGAEDLAKRALGPANPARAFVSATNGLIVVNVADAAASTAGRFTIGTAAGERLLYGHGSDPWSSYIRIMVDGVVYAPGSGGSYDANLTLLSGPTSSGSSITTSWDAGGVTLTQVLTPTVVASEATVRIEYTVSNGNQPHDVRLMLEMDTQIDANDAAPLSTSYGYTTVETCFDAPNVPSIWQAFEVDPLQGPEFLVGCGILTGFGATLPDRAAFGQWGSLYNGSFAYACSGASYGDSGCMLWWEVGAMAPGQSNHYQTYYGTCSVEVVPGELNLNLGGNTALSCDDGVLVPNPFDANLLVTNTGGDVCHNVTAVLTPGAGLAGGGMIVIGDLDPNEVGAAGFSLTALGTPCDELLTYTIDVYSDDCPSNTITGAVFVPCCRAADALDRPVAFGLGDAYPNPFNPVTVLPFTLAETGHAELAVFNQAGEKVAVLHSGLTERGTHTITFDAAALPSGVYFARLSAAGQVDSRKLVLIK